MELASSALFLINLCVLVMLLKLHQVIWKEEHSPEFLPKNIIYMNIWPSTNLT